MHQFSICDRNRSSTGTCMEDHECRNKQINKSLNNQFNVYFICFFIIFQLAINLMARLIIHRSISYHFSQFGSEHRSPDFPHPAHLFQFIQSDDRRHLSTGPPPSGRGGATALLSRMTGLLHPISKEEPHPLSKETRLAVTVGEGRNTAQPCHH